MTQLGSNSTIKPSQGSFLLKQNASKSYTLLGVIVFVVISAFVLIGGFWTGRVQSRILDAQMRKRLLDRAADIACTLNPELVRKLTFTATDKGTPVFEQFRKQMIAAGKASPGLQSGIYSTTLREGKLFFGPETYLDNDPLASLPGTEYTNPPAEIWSVFQTRKPISIGPYTDEYGTFVSTLAPILDPDSGKVLMAVGVDVPADRWQSQINAVFRKPILNAMGILLVVGLGFIAIKQYNRKYSLTGLKVKKWIIIPAAAAAMVGLAVFAGYHYLYSRHELRHEVQRLKEQITKEWNGDIDSKVQMLRIQMSNIARNPEIAKAFENRDREALVAVSLPIAEELKKKCDITHFYFMESDRTCFLRVHQPQRYGDRIDRFTMLAAERTGEDIWGLELGPLGTFTLRCVQPWLQDDKVIGYLELGLEATCLVDEMVEDMSVDIVSVVHKEYTSREKFEAGKKAFAYAGQWDQFTEVVVNHQSLEMLPDELVRWFTAGCSAYTDKDVFCLRQGSRIFDGGVIHIFDAAGINVMDMFVLRDVTTETKAAQSILLQGLGLAVVFFAGVLMMLWSVCDRAERHLRSAFSQVSESEESYRRQFVNNSSVMLLIRPADGQIVDANMAAVNFYGYSLEQLLAMCMTEINTLSASEVRQAMATVPLELGKQFQFQHRLADGSVRDVEVSASCIQFGGQTVLHSIIQDVTERKTAEQRLVDERQRLANVIEGTHAGIWEWNVQTGETVFNDRWAQMVGYTLEGLSPISIKTWEALTHPDDLKQAEAALQRHFCGEQPCYDCEFRMKHKDGHWVWVHDRGRVVTWTADGKPLMMFGTHSDITARKQAEEARQESESRMRAVTDSAQDAILMMNPQGRISYWNPAAERILGYTAQEAIGQNLHQFIVPPQYHAAHGAAFPAFQQTGQGGAVGKTLELKASGKNGKEISVELSLSAIQLKDGWHAVGIIRDITARKQAEAKLMEANCHLETATARANDLATRAELANIAKSEFLANMSHEIRTPMNGVIGMTGLLIDTELTAEQRQYAEIVRSSGESLLTLINDILDFSKIEAKKLELETLDFDIRDVLEDFSGMMAVRAQQKGLEFLCAADPDVPSYVHGDPGRLRQILTNLTGNAFKFTDQGEVDVRVAVVSKNDHDALLRFSVRDTGIGISADKLDHVFESFSQEDASTTRKYGGTGLGLTISKQLAELMGGQIGVSSIKGQGSEFWFTIQLSLQPQRDGARTMPVQLRGKRILVVDDNAANREILNVRLTSWGAFVAESSDGFSALSALRQAKAGGLPFDVVITDMQMPEMDGLMLGSAIRQDAQIKDVCLMMMSSLGQHGNNPQFAEIGFAACMIKPVRPSELFVRLTTALSGTKKSESAAPVLQHEFIRPVRSHVRILLAEDNITNQQVAMGMLKKFGLRAEAVANGAEAISALEAIHYDLVLMDVQMPELDGLEATRRIRASLSVLNPNLPIIAMTANAMQGDREKCLAAGMNDYISKPVSPKVLAEKLEQWLPREQDASTQQKDIVMDTIAKVTPIPQIPIFDKAGFLDRLMGDEEIAEKIIEVFLEDIPKQIESLKQSLDACDPETFHRVVHSIKGAAANVGGEALRQLAAQVEKACKEGDLGLVGDSCPRLESQFNELKKVMTNNKRKGTIE